MLLALCVLVVVAGGVALYATAGGRDASLPGGRSAQTGGRPALFENLALLRRTRQLEDHLPEHATRFVRLRSLDAGEARRVFSGAAGDPPIWLVPGPDEACLIALVQSLNHLGQAITATCAGVSDVLKGKLVWCIGTDGEHALVQGVVPDGVASVLVRGRDRLVRVSAVDNGFAAVIAMPRWVRIGGHQVPVTSPPERGSTVPSAGGR